MEKETVLILLLLKPMTKTSQLNDIAIMIYHGGYPVLKISIPCFLALFLKNGNTFPKLPLDWLSSNISASNCHLIRSQNKESERVRVVQYNRMVVCLVWGL